MTRSVRALWLLLLNFALGMVIWGAFMFYMEQGVYDSRMGTYIRPEDGQRSPFASIPHSFWFVIVTATTTGYGDMVPLTDAGRMFAGLCMVYSLCVLALPIGVIGSNFDAVWQEFDNEKRKERQSKRKAELMAREIIECLDPLSSSRRLMVEVLHCPPVPGNNDIFLGQAEVTLDLEPSMFTPVDKKLRCHLIENRAKSNRSVTGYLDIEYSWSPRQPSKSSVEMEGALRVTVVEAKGLACIDWKDSGQPDACVQLTLWPRSPSICDASMEPQVLRSRVILDNSNPAWNQTFVVDFVWSHDGITAKRESRRVLIDSFVGNTKLDGTGSMRDILSQEGDAGRIRRSVEELKEVRAMLPDFERDVARLRTVKDGIMREMDMNGSNTDDAIMRRLGLKRPSTVGARISPSASALFSNANTLGWPASPGSSGNSTRSESSFDACPELPNTVTDFHARTLR
mmetsp:Transcript_29172/g.82814  ORF Transcript_29172/g.82814 Transcript_29172/m.82814 type:complete len:456 (-) Transcript_29172:136-1503(-)